MQSLECQSLLWNELKIRIWYKQILHQLWGHLGLSFCCKVDVGGDHTFTLTHTPNCPGTEIFLHQRGAISLLICV